MPDDLDIVLPRSTSLNGVRPGCTIRDMFGPGHSPLVSGAFFVNMILNRQGRQEKLFHPGLTLQIDRRAGCGI